jgi:hypothetical protein
MALPNTLDAADCCGRVLRHLFQKVKLHEWPYEWLAVVSFAKRSAEHRLGKFELEVAFEPRRCSAFQIYRHRMIRLARCSRSADLQSA